MRSGCARQVWNTLRMSSSTKPKNEHFYRSPRLKDKVLRHNVKLIAIIFGCLVVTAYIWFKL
jgi:hypothetical protein